MNDRSNRTEDAFRHQLIMRHRARRRLRRFALAIGALALALTVIFPPAPRLVWNASASAPIGLYSVSPGAEVERGDMVIARLPEPWRTLAARRHYLPANVPLVKRVAGEPGDNVCAIGPFIYVNDRLVAERLRRDAGGRAMPWWVGCATLRSGVRFLLMADSLGSFDGRYFGPSSANDIVGEAHLLWRR